MTSRKAGAVRQNSDMAGGGKRTAQDVQQVRAELTRGAPGSSLPAIAGAAELSTTPRLTELLHPLPTAGHTQGGLNACNSTTPEPMRPIQDGAVLLVIQSPQDTVQGSCG